MRLEINMAISYLWLMSQAAKNEIHQKHLTKTLKTLEDLEQELHLSKQIILERERLISNLSTELARLREDNNKKVLDLTLIENEVLELRKQNERLKQNLEL